MKRTKVIICGILMAILSMSFVGCKNNDYGGIPEDEAIKIHEEMVEEADQREVVPDSDN